MSNIVYLDFETSGLDPSRHAILQAAWIVERDGEVLSEKIFDVIPEPNDDLCLAALDVNGFSLERCRSGKYLSYVLAAFTQDCLQVSSPRICGHNIQFDISFLMTAIRKLRENLTLYVDLKRTLDTRTIAQFLEYKGVLQHAPTDFKLTTLCKIFDIPLEAHDALADIRATRSLFHILEKL
jgi:DNA polymerase III epsilon subunit-like protein